MKKQHNSYCLIGYLGIALAIVILGLSLYFPMNQFVQKDRVVSVKGLSEVDVAADLVRWPLPIIELGNDLPSLYTSLDKKESAIRKFLMDNGIDDEEITLAPPFVKDRMSDLYYDQQSKGEMRNRYSITAVITVTSRKVVLVSSLIAKQGELLKQGIAVIGDRWENFPEYIFTGLNDIKPKMIEEATQNARVAAEKFAKDSKSKLGKIKTAHQGSFSIDNTNQNTPHIKHVRVVTSLEYYLKD